jgi:acetyltransferase-like isoleucine patch superfamily enzyme
MQNSKIVIESGTLRVGINHRYITVEYDATWDNCRFYLNNSVLHTVGDVFIFPGCKIVAMGGTLQIGAGTIIHAPSYIFVRKHVRIGNSCLLSRRVTIMDSDWHKTAIGNAEPTEKIEEVIIKDHCWIGQDATILKGVTIGEGAVVGANAVVTQDVQPRTMVAGNPARVIKDNVTWQS